MKRKCFNEDVLVKKITKLNDIGNKSFSEKSEVIFSDVIDSDDIDCFEEEDKD